MRGLFKTLFGWLSKEHQPLSEEQVQQLANLFRTRYHDFRLLLAANNKALELMAEMETAKAGERIFGMAFVRARSTAMLVNVLKMTKHLGRLAPDKYPSLNSRFGEIQSAMNALLSQTREARTDRFIVPVTRIDRELADEVGGKMANLGEIRNRVGLPVPPGFGITAAAYHRFLQHNDLQSEIDRLVQTLEKDRLDQVFVLSSRIRQKIVAAELPDDVAQAIHDAYDTLQDATKTEIKVAMRSSSVAEDTAGLSFAGQYSSALNVDRDGLLEAYQEIVASKYSAQAIQYRFIRGLSDRDLPMAVGCIAMVDALAGGVAYSCSALDTCNDNVHIIATWGLPKAVVEGKTAIDRFEISRAAPRRTVDRNIDRKDVRIVCRDGEGVVTQPVDDDRADQPSLTDEQIASITGAALQLEEHYGTAQDIEWAIDPAGELVILQSRPLRRVEQDRLEQPATAAELTEKDQPLPEAKVIACGGIRVSPGVATGPVHWVRREADSLTFPDGAILAVEHPEPRWAALLDRATGLIATRGSIAGHLATVAREYGRPALFALCKHVDRLEQGLEITLDADGQVIYLGTVQELLARQAKPMQRLMLGSPVHQTLTRLLEHITPLTLLDPDSPDFRSRNCQTLHDITRFCHEMSVREMFRFGKDHRLPERASKQLYYNVPMQWWVLNLDDGFHHEVKDKYVKLPDIACQPMLTLWNGMTAIPWDGPPRGSGRGLASVLFEATANPALSTPYRKPYATRNYFMISKHFMNLQSRFGFHFTTVETMMGDRDRENYIRFMFKGGAADLDRRIARVHFIGDLLNDHGFTVDRKDDTVLGRLTDVDYATLDNRLRTIGYLLMHTRQLDMIMADPVAVRRYRAKMDQDIEKLHQNPTGGPD